MISVQNPLLPLSGNKLVIGLLICFLGACSVHKRGSIEFTPVEPKVKTVTSKDTTTIIPEETVEVPKVRKTYQLALILPFFLSTLESVMFDEETEEEMMLPPKSHLSLEFYEGVLVGLDSLQRAGMKAQVHVFDSNHDTARIGNLIRSKQLDKMDLIIGPVFNNCLKQVAQFSKDHKITLLSPLSPADYVTSQNPNFVMCNPSLKVHLHKIAEHVKSQYPSARLLIISSSGTYERTVAETMRNYLLKTRKSGSSILIMQVDNKTTASTLKARLDDSVTNVIIVASFEEPFVNNILTKLSALVKDRSMVLYGMPTWMSYQSLRIDYMVKLNLHLSQSFWSRHLDVLNKPFTTQFHNKYKAYPSAEAFKGYYTALLCGWILEGGGLTEPIPSQLSEIYDLYPSKQGGRIDFYENRKLKILHISDLAWVESR